MSENCFVCEIKSESINKLKDDMQNQGFEFQISANAIFSAKKKGISAVLYTSGKFVLQGKDIKEFVEFYLEPEILKNLSYSHPFADYERISRIGVDEAGKGDYFGPLSIGAVYVQENQIETLLKIGIKDSKKLNDETVLKMSEKIKSLCAYESIVIYPQRYNELYEQFKNLNHLLAWGHSKAIENLSSKTGCKEVILDQFAASKKVIEDALKRKSLHLSVKQMHKAESDLAVASASIIARAGFLNGLQKMKSHFNMEFPKGASHIVKEAAKSFILQFGKSRLNEVVKLHFKTTQELE